MEKEVIKQWDLPKHCTVQFKDGSTAEYLGMDGMYAKWNADGQFQIGNFEGFTKEGDVYKPID